MLLWVAGGWHRTGQDALQPHLTLAFGPAGEQLASPTHVRFAAETAHHLLQWEPGHNTSNDVRYEVQHKV